MLLYRRPLLKLTSLILSFTFFGTHTVSFIKMLKPGGRLTMESYVINWESYVINWGNGHNSCQLCSYGFDNFAIELAEKVSITRPGNAPTD